MIEKVGRLFVLTGPSGAGKGTILSQVLKQRPDIYLSISATTRAPRPGEKEGVSYYFLTQADFQAKIQQGAFLEYAEYVNHYYGTLEEPVDAVLKQGKDVLLEIELQGAEKVHQKRPDAVMVFIAPPSFEALASRLRGRGTENEATIKKRLEIAKQELGSIHEFDYLVVNDDLQQATRELLAILLAEKCRVRK